MSSKKIKRSSESLFSEEEFQPANSKERVNCMIDGDVVNWMRTKAAKLGIGYQTYMNMRLRGLMNNDHSMPEKVEFDLDVAVMPSATRAHLHQKMHLGPSPAERKALLRGVDHIAKKSSATSTKKKKAKKSSSSSMVATRHKTAPVK